MTEAAAAMPTVKLASKEGKEFVVEQQVAMMSGTIARLFSDLVGFNDDNDDDDEPIPLIVVTSEQLEKVLKWCNYHKDDTPALEDEAKLDPWDQAFFAEMEKSLLYGTMAAASYMDIPGLVKAATMMLADKIKGKSCEEMREILGIENDLTAEEEEKLQMEFGWIYQ